MIGKTWDIGLKFAMALNRDENERSECDDDGVSLLDFNSSDSASTLVPIVEDSQETSLKNGITSSSRPCFPDASSSKEFDLEYSTLPAKGTRTLRRHRFWDICIALIHSILTIPFFVYCILAWRLNRQLIDQDQQD